MDHQEHHTAFAGVSSPDSSLPTLNDFRERTEATGYEEGKVSMRFSLSPRLNVLLEGAEEDETFGFRLTGKQREKRERIKGEGPALLKCLNRLRSLLLQGYLQLPESQKVEDELIYKVGKHLLVWLYWEELEERILSVRVTEDTGGVHAKPLTELRLVSEIPEEVVA